MHLQSKIILASQSVARKEILSKLGILNPEVSKHEVEESKFDFNFSVSRSIIKLAYLKAESVKKKKLLKKHKSIIIAADTVIYRAKKIFYKPKCQDEVRSHLKNLSSRKHIVFGGICVISPKGKVYKKLVKTEVYFHKIVDSELTQEILEDGIGKAGGYAIQNLGIRFVKKIRGCYTNIVGISIPELYKILKSPEFI
ncbi:MAG: septum formation inhibitor Maf [Rickettsiales bacterium]|nr:septum formation inhibitor Maf [Rickettsiales bacterium]